MAKRGGPSISVKMILTTTALIVITVIDLIVMALAWNEYRVFKRHLSTR
jgi:uncharacterized membrane protein